jgi:hypothetical protein
LLGLSQAARPGSASAIGHVGTPAGYDLDQALIRENPDSLASSEPRHLWVPKTPSTSCDQAIFVDRAADERPSADAVLPYFDLFG